MIEHVYLVQKRTAGTVGRYELVAICIDLVTVRLARKLHQVPDVEIHVEFVELNKIAPVFYEDHPRPHPTLSWHNAHVIELVRLQNQKEMTKPRTVHINGKPITLPPIKAAVPAPTTSPDEGVRAI
jgi:hypothetical protein